MKFAAITIFITLTLSAAFAENWPGFKHKATLIDQRSSSDDPKHATLFLKINSADFRARTLAIRYEIDTKKVISAWWMTKGNFPLIIPVMGAFVTESPKNSKIAMVCLSQKEIIDIEKQQIAYLWIQWPSLNPQSTEQGAAANP